MAAVTSAPYGCPMLSEILWTIAAIWGFSAVATVIIFTVDERAHQRRTADHPIDREPAAVADIRIKTGQVISGHLVTSTAI